MILQNNGAPINFNKALREGSAPKPNFSTTVYHHFTLWPLTRTPFNTNTWEKWGDHHRAVSCKTYFTKKGGKNTHKYSALVTSSALDDTHVTAIMG